MLPWFEIFFVDTYIIFSIPIVLPPRYPPMGLSENFLKRVKANATQWRTYCLGCISKYKRDHPLDTSGMDEAQKFEAERAWQEAGMSSLRVVFLPLD
jgi:hypothetical protein